MTTTVISIHREIRCAISTLTIIIICIFTDTKTVCISCLSNNCSFVWINFFLVKKRTCILYTIYMTLQPDKWTKQKIYTKIEYIPLTFYCDNNCSTTVIILIKTCKTVYYNNWVKKIRWKPAMIRRAGILRLYAPYIRNDSELRPGNDSFAAGLRKLTTFRTHVADGGCARALSNYSIKSVYS